MQSTDHHTTLPGVKTLRSAVRWTTQSAFETQPKKTAFTVLRYSAHNSTQTTNLDFFDVISVVNTNGGATIVSPLRVLEAQLHTFRQLRLEFPLEIYGSHSRPGTSWQALPGTVRLAGRNTDGSILKQQKSHQRR